MFGISVSRILSIALLFRLGAGAPFASSVSSSAPQSSPTVPFVDTNPNLPLWGPNTDPNDPVVAPIRGQLGATVLGPDNKPIDLQSPDILAPPTTDHGSVPNVKWPFSMSHNRLFTGGWARTQNGILPLPVFFVQCGNSFLHVVDALPVAKAMAAVNMRLKAGAIRELHWHKTSEWAYVLKGYTQVTAVDTEGRNFVGTAGPGDLWFFPAGIPHSLQATNDTEDGSEFILVFDDGEFADDQTFLLTDWLAHTPYEVLLKNFGVESDAFARIPGKELFIFPGTDASFPGPDSDAPQSPQGTVPEPYVFPLSKMNATTTPGGTVKIVDSSIFKISTTIAMAEVTVNPGGMRELHWHPTMDEWSFFLEGEGRVTVFASQGNARTFNYQAGDIGYVPSGMGHYVENTGNTTLRFLEIFNTARFQDVSLNQWLALTPPELVKAHLNIDDATVAKLSKTKQVVPSPISPELSSALSPQHPAAIHDLNINNDVPGSRNTFNPASSTSSY
ncbi:hypothetical protein V5O48_008031 [Marasmius crinis-equi]|uniref:Cupin type-1 domain-containing protein n=1 Tax=Marasmius crinis-equi TaxID=585013 RepID=A0ABR3FF53_9AGAR